MESKLTQTWREEKEQRMEQNKIDGGLHIFHLPTELVEMILCYVDNESLLHVRLACRTLKNISLSFFGTRFFKNLTAILHPRSLGVLSDIATHPELSKFITKLTISGEKVGRDIALKNCVHEIAILQEQDKMEISGSDRVILGAVFSKLMSLEVVRLDNVSYYHKPKGLCCGKQDIFTQTFSGRETNSTRSTNGRDRGYYLYTFGVVFSIIEYSPNQRMITWELQFTTDTYYQPIITLWDPYSEEWVQRFARKVRSLDFQPWCERDFPWALDMFHFVDQLEKLEICGGSNSLELSHPVTGMFFWPKLSRFSIKCFNTRQDIITDFLHLHRATLSNLELDHIGINSGSWKKVLEVVVGMQKLQHIRLDDLQELDAHFPSYAPWEQTIPERVLSDKDFSASSVEGSSQDGVTSILQALTLRFRSELKGLRQTVNMRLACAVVQGVVEYVHGRYLPRGYSLET